jgi:transcriptional regulator with XRE-family HTH domain
MKIAERNEARRLRREHDLSLKDIASRLGVAKSSVSLWVRDIELTPEQERRLRDQNGMYTRQLLAHAAWREFHRRRRQAAQQEGRMRARENDPLPRRWLHALLGRGQ